MACARMRRMMLSTWWSLMWCARAQDVGQGGQGPGVKGGDPGGGETLAAAAVAENGTKRSASKTQTFQIPTLSALVITPAPLQDGTISQPLPCLVQHLHL